MPHSIFQWMRHVLLIAGLAVVACSASAQAYPAKPIRLIVPTAAGAVTDIAARLIAAKMSVLLGQTVFVENKAGGGTRIGSEYVARAPADGYTLLYAYSVTHGTLSALSKSLPYDPIKDFTPIAGLFWYASTIVCNPSVPVNNVNEMIAYAKKNPDKLSNASAGQGSGNHLSGELFNSMAGVQILHVPYKGSGPAMADVIAGVASCTHDGTAKQYVDAGRVKAIATTGLQRDPRFPNLPTVDESGLKGYNVTWWQGLTAPAGTPPEVIAKLSQAAQIALAEPDTRLRAYEIGLNVQYLSTPDMGKQMVESIDKFKKIVAQAKIPVE